MGNDISNFLNTSSHPAVTGSPFTGVGTTITQSFCGSMLINGFESSSYCIVNGTASANCEYVLMDQPAVGVKNRVSDKIKINNTICASGSVLSAYKSIQQDCFQSQSYTCNVNVLEVGLSPTNQINDDIIGRYGHFNIGNLIGDPRSINAAGDRYGDLNRLSERYFEAYKTPYQLKEFINLIRFFDNSVFKTIKDFTPAKLNAAVGIIIKQHLLERNKYNQPVMTYSTPEYTGSVVNLPRDYTTGSVYLYSGGPGGVFNKYNGLNSSPSASAFGLTASAPLVDFTQSWTETINYISGSFEKKHYGQDEFYDGEFSGSTITATTGSLNIAWQKIKDTETLFIAGACVCCPVSVSMYNTVLGNCDVPGTSEATFDNITTLPNNSVFAFCGGSGVVTKFKFAGNDTNLNNALANFTGSFGFTVGAGGLDYDLKSRTICKNLSGDTLFTLIETSASEQQSTVGTFAGLDDYCINSAFSRSLGAGLSSKLKPNFGNVQPGCSVNLTFASNLFDSNIIEAEAFSGQSGFFYTPTNNPLLQYKVTPQQQCVNIGYNVWVGRGASSVTTESMVDLCIFRNNELIQKVFCTGITDQMCVSPTKIYGTFNYDFSGGGVTNLQESDTFNITLTNVSPGSSSFSGCLEFISSSFCLSVADFGTGGGGSPANFVSSTSGQGNTQCFDAGFASVYTSSLLGYPTSSQIPLLNNVSESRKNNCLVYTQNTSSRTITAVTNQDCVVTYETSSNNLSTVPKSYYTDKSQISSRYVGNQVCQNTINIYSDGDTGTLGLSPSIENLGTFVGFFNEVKTTFPILNNKVSTKLLYLIDDLGNAATPNLNSQSFYNVIDNFTQCERGAIDLNTSSDKELNILNGLQTIFRSGCYPIPITRTQNQYVVDGCDLKSGNGELYQSYFATTMSFGSLDVATGLDAGIIDFQSSYSDLSGEGIAVDGKAVTMSTDDTSNACVTLESTGELTLNDDADGVTLSANGVIGICHTGGTAFNGDVIVRSLVNGVICQSDFTPVFLNAGFRTNLSYNVGFGTNRSSGDKLGICLDLSCVNNSMVYCDLDVAGLTPSNINLTQVPTPAGDGGSAVCGPFWALSGSNPNTKITSSNALGCFYDNGNFQLSANSQSSATVNTSGSLFDRIQEPFIICKGDEFRWNNDETTAALVVNACKVGSSVHVEFDQAVNSASINLNDFVHRRYKKDGSYIIVNQQLPSQSFDGSGIIFPEYATDDIGGQSADEVIQILAEKNLVTKTN